MDKFISLFIKTHIDEIDNEDWVSVYKAASKELLTPAKVNLTGIFTNMLHDAEIYPYKQLKNVPDYYFCHSKQSNIQHVLADKLHLGNFAFCDCNITDVTVPEGVDYIGICCFSKCSKLNKLQLPSTIRYIRSWAFKETTFETLLYSGTMEQWKQINCVDGWHKDSLIQRVNCIDGVIDIED